MRYEIHPLWPGMPRIAGPALTIRTGRHDNLMFHASIHLARPGDILVVEAGDDEMAVAGGNVYAIAQRRARQTVQDPEQHHTLKEETPCASRTRSR